MNIEPFEKYSDKYEEWFENNKYAYESELKAVENLLPKKGFSLDIGVGSGRFAVPFKIGIGLDPSVKMLNIAKKNGIKCVCGIAEKLPFKNFVFDFALMVTSICFVDDILKTFTEAYRVLKKNGVLVIGFVDKESDIGKKYLQRKDKSIFYKTAKFYSTEEVVDYLKLAGFKGFSFCQTLVNADLKHMNKPDAVLDGFGKGSFVVIKALKSS